MNVVRGVELGVEEQLEAARHRPHPRRLRRTAGASERFGAELAVLELRQVPFDLQADEAAVAQEIVRTAARSDISEEVARFRGHVAHWLTLADAAEPCGRKLDFLAQEFNREANTLCAKSSDIQLTHVGLALKAVIDQFREQVQNVE